MSSSGAVDSHPVAVTETRTASGSQASCTSDSPLEISSAKAAAFLLTIPLACSLALLQPGIAGATVLDKVRSIERSTEQIVASVKSEKTLEKFLSAASGPLISPDHVKAVLNLEEQEEVAENVPFDLLETIVDRVTSFSDLISDINVFSEGEAAYAALAASIETLFEKLTALELSSLLIQGERMVIFGPVLAAGMFWQMKFWENRRAEEVQRDKDLEQEESEEARLRRLQVEKELRRLQLKSELLEEIELLGEDAVGPSAPGSATRRDVEIIAQELVELCPREGVPVLPAESSEASDDADSTAGPSDDLAGSWRLIFVSEGSFEQEQMKQLGRFPGLSIAGFVQDIELRKRADDGGAGRMRAHNTAEIRLGPIGSFRVDLEGDWKTKVDRNNDNAYLAISNLSVKPLELFGAKLNDELPMLQLPMPSRLESRVDWATLYLDYDLRINRGTADALYIFQRVL